LSGAGYDLCIAVHAESNSILQAGGRAGCLGGSLYLGSHNRKWNGTRYNEGMGDFPCDNCGRLIIQAGIECVYQREEDGKIVGHLIQNLVKVGKLF
jgi:deoxycytidylate deaminase